MSEDQPITTVLETTEKITENVEEEKKIEVEESVPKSDPPCTTEEKEEEEEEEEKDEEMEEEPKEDKDEDVEMDKTDSEEDTNEDNSVNTDTDSDMENSEEDDTQEKLPEGMIEEREWFQHIVGMPEEELREEENIKKIISKAERIEKYNTHRFEFTNVENGNTYDAGYFYLESIKSLKEEFDKRPGEPEKFKSCKIIADVRQDYVIT